jgi:hypothetical protein
MACLACSRGPAVGYPVWTDGVSATTIQPQVRVRKLAQNEIGRQTLAVRQVCRSNFILRGGGNLIRRMDFIRREK